MTNHFSPLHQFSLIGNGYVEHSAEKSSEVFSRFDRKRFESLEICTLVFVMKTSSKT